MAERLREEVEGKSMIPRTQAFRKRMGTIDDIYILNYFVNRQIGRAGGKLVPLFMNLRAAFDTVDRGVLVETMKRKELREGLVKRVKEVVRETKRRVREGVEMGEGFWMIRGLRQGCPLSPLLFNIFVTDIEEEMEKVRWGEVRIGGRRVYMM